MSLVCAGVLSCVCKPVQHWLACTHHSHLLTLLLAQEFSLGNGTGAHLRPMPASEGFFFMPLTTLAERDALKNPPELISQRKGVPQGGSGRTRLVNEMEDSGYCLEEPVLAPGATHTLAQVPCNEPKKCLSTYST